MSSTIGRRGTLVIAAELRRAYGLEEGSAVIQDPTPEAILIRPAATVPVRAYSQQDRAVFLLNNAATESEYREAREEVKAMGLDPDRLQHQRFDLEIPPRR
ncbi:MAG: AbrB/MazE/SpoVT family DNA-binding domain-containing protein [Verrucomicrobiota bacterium]